MALIKNRKGRKDGGDSRLFGNTEIGELISRVQAAVISTGTELERIIKNEVQQIKIKSLDDFLKQQIKKSHTLNFAESEPDFVIFRRRNNKTMLPSGRAQRRGHVRYQESRRREKVHRLFISKNAQHLPYTVTAHFCCFNQNSRQEIVKGFKSKITMDEAMTGKEFCELLEINYDKIVEMRTVDQSKNLAYFVQNLFCIKAVQDLLDR